MLLELDESIFLRIYGPEWESGENLSNVLVVTLADYFQVKKNLVCCVMAGGFCPIFFSNYVFALPPSHHPNALPSFYTGPLDVAA